MRLGQSDSEPRAENRTPLSLGMADESVPTWEICKENVAPRKGGRDVKKLTRSFGAALANPDKDAADAAEKARFEAAVAAESADPLEPWLRYVAWLEETFPSDGVCSLEARGPTPPSSPARRGARREDRRRPLRSGSGARGASRTRPSTGTTSGT